MSCERRRPPAARAPVGRRQRKNSRAAASLSLTVIIDGVAGLSRPRRRRRAAQVGGEHERGHGAERTGAAPGACAASAESTTLAGDLAASGISSADRPHGDPHPAQMVALARAGGNRSGCRGRWGRGRAAGARPSRWSRPSAGRASDERRAAGVSRSCARAFTGTLDGEIGSCILARRLRAGATSLSRSGPAG